MKGKDILKVLTRVNRGIKWLDRKFGRRVWLKKININRLVLQDTSTCVIGEVMGDFAYFKGKGAFNGFDKGDEEFETLTAIWVMRLRELGAK